MSKMKTKDVHTTEDLITYLSQQTGFAHLTRKGDGQRLFAMMKEMTPFLPSNAKPKVRAMMILSGCDKMPECPQCHKDVGIEKDGGRLLETCGDIGCVGKQKRVSAVKTNTELYGCDFPNQNPDVYERGTKAGMLRNHGKHYTQTEEYKNKATGQKRSEEQRKNISDALKRTFADEELKREIVTKREETYESSTGFRNPSQNPEAKEKVKATQEANYGGWYLSSPKAKEDRIAAFGCENFFSTEEFREMQKGKMHHLQNETMLETIHNKEWCEDFIEEHGIDLQKLAELSNCSLSSAIIWLSKHGLYEQKERGDSFIEKSVEQMLVDLGVGFDKNRWFSLDGVRREADFYIPSLNIAIECNGNFFHSDVMKEDRYHLHKTEMFNSLGIQLLHFFEDEILVKMDIVKSMIAAKTCKIESLGARNTKVVSLSPREAGEFYEKHHIQGKVKASYHYGLVNENGVLVAAMSFRNGGRNLKDGETELVRFASSIRVVGGVSKLIKHYSRNEGSVFTHIVSYADRRVSSGGVYTACGFSHVSSTPPSYFYMHKSNYLVRMRKENFKKSLIKENLDFFDVVLTERENMEINGYRRIYDCGLMKFVKEL